MGVRGALRLDILLGLAHLEVAYEHRFGESAGIHTARVVLAFDFGLLLMGAINSSDED